MPFIIGYLVLFGLVGVIALLRGEHGTNWPLIICGIVAVFWVGRFLNTGEGGAE